MKRRVLVCGGRDYAELEAVRAEFRLLSAGSVVIHGCAPGADSLADQVAKEMGFEVLRFPADWSRGKKAGPERNLKMLREGKPTMVLAFPGGSGTANMVALALRARVPIRRGGMMA